MYLYFIELVQFGIYIDILKYSIFDPKFLSNLAKTEFINAAIIIVLFWVNLTLKYADFYKDTL